MTGEGEIVSGLPGFDHVEAHRDGFTLAFMQPATPVSINAVAGRSRRSWAWRVNSWKATTTTLATDAMRALEIPQDGSGIARIGVLVSWQARGARRRDPHNYSSTTVKAVVDGLVAAGVVADDTGDQVVVYDPVIRAVTGRDPLNPLWAWVDVVIDPPETRPDRVRASA